MKLLLPSPYLREVIEKTAEFVAKNGRIFEEKIKEKYKKVNTFLFLNKENIFNIFYLHRLKFYLFSKNKFNKYKVIKHKKKSHIADLIFRATNLKFLKSIDFTCKEIMILKTISIFISYNGKKFIRYLFFNGYFIKTFKLFSLFNLKILLKLVMIYSYITYNKKFLNRIFLKTMFNGLILFKNSKIKNYILKYRQLYRHSKNLSSINNKNQYDWKNFVVVHTVDFYKYEIYDLPKPITKEKIIG